ncbi:MAG: alpha/beta fold hydrolase [Paludibacter sp.]|nr:alpha/beta fold hydrolase [Paludibacter sp.]
MKTSIIIKIILLLFVSNIYGLKPDSTYNIRPNKYALMYKEYKIKTLDGYTLNAWFYPAQKEPTLDTSKYYFEKKTLIRPYNIESIKKPTLIICDGDVNNMSPHVGYAYNYCTNGFNVITFDWRGFGESEHFHIDNNYLVYPEFIIDYNAIVDFATQLQTVDAERIGVFGYSTGAFLSFAIASQRSEVKAIVVRGLFTDYKSLIPNLNKIFPEKNLIYPVGIDKYSPRSNWETFNKSIFLIVGDLDVRTPKENSIEILSHIKSNVRELWIVDKAGHGGFDAPEVLFPELFYKKTIRFFKENL